VTIRFVRYAGTKRIDSAFITSNQGILKKSREKMMVSLTMSAEFSKYPDKKWGCSYYCVKHEILSSTTYK
jgi:hypothetical protein